MIPLKDTPLEIQGWHARQSVPVFELDKAIATAFDFEPEELKGRWVGHEESRVRGIVLALAYDLNDRKSQALGAFYGLTGAGVRAAIRRARVVLHEEQRKRRKVLMAVENHGITWSATRVAI
jgi:hypothetical protein